MAAQWDYVIVGAGTTGAVLAARLAGRPGLRVCLLDARSGPQPSGRRAIAFRPPAEHFRRWEAAGAAGWSPLGIIRAWQKLRDTVDAAEPPPAHPGLAACLAAAEQAGYPETDFLHPFTAGAGWLYHHRAGTLGASESDAPLAYIASQAPNLRVVQACPVRRILLERGRAVGVETAAGPVHADREVIVCAGAVESARLLMLSGIGPAERLREHAIRVVADVPGVGAHLLRNVACPLRFAPARSIGAPPAGARAAAAFCRTEGGLTVADVWVRFTVEPVDSAASDHALGMALGLAHTRTAGTLHLQSADPAAAPRIDYEPLSDADGEDLRTMRAGLELGRDLAAQPALADWIAGERDPGSGVRSAAELGAYARCAALPVGPPAGTCRMGAPGDPASVVDPALRVRGVEGLRVAGPAAFPESVGVDAVTTCMIVAEKCATLLQDGG